MKVLSTFSITAEVGKTATAVNLAYLCALEGARTLLWDLDPKAAATYALTGDDIEDAAAGKLTFAGSELAPMIAPTRYSNLDLVSSNAGLLHRNGNGNGSRGRGDHQKIDRMLAPLAADYDCVILDCPPGIDDLTEAVFFASDSLLVPVIPTVVSVREYDALADSVREFERKHRPRSVAVTGFFSKVEERRELHAAFIELFPEGRADVLHCTVPRASEVAETATRRAPVHTFAPGSPAAAAYEELWRTVRHRLGDTFSRIA